MSNYPQYNLNNQHELIKRQNTYVLDRKLVTIHSEDRDISKWPNTNMFEVELPEVLSNVQSMRLVEIALPANQYIFSNNQQNIKMQFYVTPRIRNATYMNYYTILESNKNIPYNITIQEGYYTPDQMANEIENRMNNAVKEVLINGGISSPNYDLFKVKYDKVGQRLVFGNTYDNFYFPFNIKVYYDISCSSIISGKQNSNVWEQYSCWGLPAYIGFDKKLYNASETEKTLSFNYDNVDWLTPNMILLPTGQTAKAYYVNATYTTSMFGDSAIYMEFDKYNSIDELTPYSSRTNNMYNNDYSGKVNAAFAKIPITNTPSNINNQLFDSRNNFLQNVSQYNPPIEKIKKVKVLFRYHDGRLVDFKDSNFNFTIAFDQLKDEISRDYVIRVPQQYSL